MKPLLNTTATLAICLSLATPAPMLAQDASAAACDKDRQARTFPCIAENGALVDDNKAYRAARKEANAGKDADSADAPATEQNASTETQTGDAEADAVTADTEATDGSASAEAEAEAAAPQQDTLEATQETAAPIAPVPPAETSGDAPDPAATAAVPEAEAGAAEGPATTVPEPQPPADATAESAAPQVSLTPPETVSEAPAGVDPAGEPEGAASVAGADPAPATEVPGSAGTQAPVAAAAAAAQADGTAPAEEVEVTTETVTEENSRSSNEEFATGIETAPAAAPAGATQKKARARDDKDEDGLSNFEKALLLGLGAIGVGQLLNNGDEVVSRSADRLVVERDGELRVLKDDDALLRQPGSDLRTETFRDGSTRTTVMRADGSQIVTIRAADGRVLSRTRITPEGEAVVIFDDTLPVAREASGQSAEMLSRLETSEQEALVRALEAELAGEPLPVFSLQQVREVPRLRTLAPEVGMSNINFSSGSSAITPEQARSLVRIGTLITETIAENPRAVFLVEGHTDAVGGAAMNLALSDRRAESVALALTEYFDVPPENLIVQGYGESELKVATEAAEPANRRAVVRDITGLLR